MPNATPANAVLVVIDVAKHCNEVLIEEPHRIRHRLTVPDCRADHEWFVDVLEAYGQPIVAAFEATGNHHWPLAHRLLGAGLGRSGGVVAVGA